MFPGNEQIVTVKNKKTKINNSVPLVQIQIGGWVGAKMPRPPCLETPPPAIILGRGWGCGRHSQNSWERSSFQHLLGLFDSFLPVRRVQNTSPRKHPDQMLIHLYHLLLMWRSISSTLSFFWIIKLLIWFVRPTPDTLFDEAHLCSLYIIFSLILLVMSRSSWFVALVLNSFYHNRTVH